MTSLKTTIAGLIALLTGLGILAHVAADVVDGKAINYEQASAGIAGVTTGIGLMFARDNNVSSEEAIGPIIDDEEDPDDSL